MKSSDDNAVVESTERGHPTPNKGASIPFEVPTSVTSVPLVKKYAYPMNVVPPTLVGCEK